jgi:hypothetical protein
MGKSLKISRCLLFADARYHPGSSLEPVVFGSVCGLTQLETARRIQRVNRTHNAQKITNLERRQDPVPLFPSVNV